MKKSILPILILLSLFLISCSNQEKNQPFDPMESSIFRMAEVKYARALEDLEVKSGASNSYTTISTLNPGDVTRVLGKIDEWYVVRLENYRVGCIDSTKTKPVVRDNRRVDRPGRVRRPEADPDQQPEQPDESIPPQEPDVEQPNDPDPVEQPDPTPEQPENQPQEPERPTIPDTPNEDTDTSTPDSELQQLISLINQERRKNGLLSLVEDPELSRVARVKAQDIIDNNYFSHYSPTYGSPFDMINEFGIEYQYAGENLAQNTSVAKAHEALMNSSGHRKNILSPNFTHVGIGIKKAERGYIYVEMFIGVPN